jgi:hypothetical protein
MENTITGEIKVGNTLIISGWYVMDIPQNGVPNDLDYIRTCDIYLDARFTSKPTVVATVHHVDTPEQPTQGNSVPFAIAAVDVDTNWGTDQTRVMIMATELQARRISYKYWCEYMVMGEMA